MPPISRSTRHATHGPKEPRPRCCPPCARGRDRTPPASHLPTRDSPPRATPALGSQAVLPGEFDRPCDRVGLDSPFLDHVDPAHPVLVPMSRDQVTHRPAQLLLSPVEHHGGLLVRCWRVNEDGFLFSHHQQRVRLNVAELAKLADRAHQPRMLRQRTHPDPLGEICFRFAGPMLRGPQKGTRANRTNRFITIEVDFLLDYLVRVISHTFAYFQLTYTA